MLSGKNIDFVQETKYLGVIINTSMKTSSGISRQNVNFMHKPIPYCAISIIAPMT